MYWYILYIGKPQNEWKNCEKKSENLNIFIETFFCILKKKLKNITVVWIGYTYGQIYVIF